MKRIIVNADDLGLAEGINEAVIRAHREGILTSASLMANGPAFGHAVRLAKDNPALGIGVHLNVVRGAPLLPAARLSAVTGPEGKFGGAARLVAQLALGRIDPAALADELAAQIDRVVSSGIAPTHLDTEKHVHALPPVFRAAVEAGKRFGITRVRNVHQRFSARYALNAKAAVFSLCEAMGMERARRREDVISPDAVFGVFDGGRMTRDLLLGIFASAGEGTSEILCHPGPDGIPPGTVRDMGAYRLVSRASELAALTDPGVREAAGRMNVSFVSYRELQ